MSDNTYSTYGLRWTRTDSLATVSDTNPEDDPVVAVPLFHGDESIRAGDREGFERFVAEFNAGKRDRGLSNSRRWRVELLEYVHTRSFSIDTAEPVVVPVAPLEEPLPTEPGYYVAEGLRPSGNSTFYLDGADNEWLRVRPWLRLWGEAPVAPITEADLRAYLVGGAYGATSKPARLVPLTAAN